MIREESFDGQAGRYGLTIDDKSISFVSKLRLNIRINWESVDVDRLINGGLDEKKQKEDNCLFNE